MIHTLLFLLNFYANWRVINLIFDLFTKGEFRWALAGFMAWVGIQSGAPLMLFP